MTLEKENLINEIIKILENLDEKKLKDILKSLNIYIK